MRAPSFWMHDGMAAALLSPLEPLTAALTARRAAGPGWTAPVPVICCGNAGVGGSGKTPLALDILARLRARGLAAHAITRGHGGGATGVLRVDPAAHDARAVGDEALLLAAASPCWVSADRAAAARAAVADGAQVLVLDDGLQNPGLTKTASILVIDGGAGFGNTHLLPAGPLREAPARAAARCRVAVIIGDDDHGAAGLLPPTLPVLRARLAPDPSMRRFEGNRVLAFAGIGRPAKFFASVRDAGLIPIACRAFADHHRYTGRELAALRRHAAREGATLVTTAKDFARLDVGDRAGIVPLTVSIVWKNEPLFEKQLAAWCGQA